MNDYGTPAPVDLRSDTVTLPTEAMREAMARAPLGDDGLDGDPGVNLLQEEAAALLGKEAALFFPSATMANLAAVLAQAERQTQMVAEASAHMYTTERAGSTLSGVFYAPVAGRDGAMDLDLLEQAIGGTRGNLPTTLVCLETSHNNAGGAVLPLEHMRAAHGLAAARGIPVHLDGARLFNAAVALGLPARVLAEQADTVTVCLSKGLSAPVGSVLAGPRATLARAKKIRKVLGGTLRQAGMLAAAGSEGLRSMVDRLAEDHHRAAQLAAALNALGASFTASVPQTNIVLVDLGATGSGSADWVARLEAAGLKVRPWGPTRLRCVTHRHIDDTAVDRAVAAFTAVERIGAPSRTRTGAPVTGGGF